MVVRPANTAVGAPEQLIRPADLPQKQFGQCSAAFMTAKGPKHPDGFCAKTCGRCGCGSPASSASSASPARTAAATSPAVSASPVGTRAPSSTPSSAATGREAGWAAIACLVQAHADMTASQCLRKLQAFTAQLLHLEQSCELKSSPLGSTTASATEQCQFCSGSSRGPVPRSPAPAVRSPATAAARGPPAPLSAAYVANCDCTDVPPAGTACDALVRSCGTP